MTNRPELILIAAVARNGVIGRDNHLPWKLKADLARFKAVTNSYPILMGRKTWESLGRPLPGRRNLVVTRSLSYIATGAEVFASPQAAVTTATNSDKLFVIGGAELYRQLLPVANRLMITEVWADVVGDTKFPPLDLMTFEEVRREPNCADAENEFDFDFVEYIRRR